MALTWSDVSLERGWIHVRAENAKSDKFREIPISARLRSVLAMAHHDPAGREFGLHHHPFDNKIGRRIASPKKMWGTALRKAKITDLRFHDLRHEAGSRWLEAGMSLHHVKELLGHASISTTDTYLNATRTGLKEAMEKIEAARCKDVASSVAEEPRLSRNDDRESDGKTLIH